MKADLNRVKGTAVAQTAAIGASMRASMASAMSLVGIAGPAMGLLMAGREAMTFEKAMIDVRANARLLGSEGAAAFGKLNKIARQLGATTQFTAVEAANALNKLVLGGLTAEEAVGAVPAVLDLAASASIELAMAAKIVVDNMRKYGLEAKDTGRIADYLSSAQSRAQITALDMASGLQSLGSAAVNMNVGFRDAVAVLTGMGRAGSQMNKAGVALALMMTRLAAQPADVKKALGDLNIEMRDFVGPGGAFDLIGAMKAIAVAMPEDPLRKQAVSFALFGMRGREIMGVLNLMKRGRFVEDVAKGLKEDLGRAAEVAAAKMKTFWGTLRRVTAALSEVAITALTPVLKALAPLLDLFARFAKPLLTIISLLVVYKYRMGLASVATYVFSGAVTTAKAAVWGLNTAINVLMGSAFMQWMVKIAGSVISLGVALASFWAVIVGGVFAWTIRAAAAAELAEHMKKMAEPLPTFAQYRGPQPAGAEGIAESAVGGTAGAGVTGFMAASDIGRKVQEMLMARAGGDKQAEMVDLLDASKTIQNNMLIAIKGKEEAAVLE